MWTIYDIRHDCYWNAQLNSWCSVEEATRYTVQERNRVPLPSLAIQWRFIEPHFISARPAQVAMMSF
jgi:hypothetical protein